MATISFMESDHKNFPENWVCRVCLKDDRVGVVVRTTQVYRRQGLQAHLYCPTKDNEVLVHKKCIKNANADLDGLSKFADLSTTFKTIGDLETVELTADKKEVELYRYPRRSYDVNPKQEVFKKSFVYF